MRVRESIASVVFAWVLIAIAPGVQAEEGSNRPEGVDDYMTYHLGRWESNTSYFDSDGKVVRTAVEGYGEKALVDGQVNLHYSYTSEGSVNTAFRFYNTKDDKVFMIDVTYKGDWWVLSGKRGEDTLYSHEKELQDGRKLTLRFTHKIIGPKAFDAVAEISFDQGQSWRLYSQQRYRKIGDGFER